MESKDVNEIIDKIAEKLGVAVEKIEPIATEVVKQVQMRGLALAISCLVIGIIYIIFIVTLQKSLYKKFAEKEGGFPEGSYFMYFALLLLIPITISGIQGLLSYLAPLAKILGV